jgi:hypothetical protein
MSTNKLTRGLGALALLAVWGCQTLDVTNPNEPDRERALHDPASIQSIAAGAFQTWFNAYTDLRGAGVLSVQARTLSSSWNNGNLNYHQGVYLADGSRMNPADTTISPLTWTRNGGAFANDPANSARTTIDAFWGGGLDESAISRPGFYASLSSANTALNAIRNDGLVITDAANTKRVETISELMQGASLMVLSLTYDKAYIVDENTDLSTLAYSTRDLVRDAAVTKLLAAAALAEANTFTTEGDWVNGWTEYSNTDIAKVAYTMAAMTLAWYPRDATEKAAVDWAAVKTYASKGISTGGQPFDAQGDGYNAWVSELTAWFTDMSSGRVHTRVAHFMDPATQVDPYRLGVGSVQPNSPDKRMGDGSFSTADIGSSYHNVPKTANAGTDFAWLRTGEVFRSDRGFYAQSNIGHSRYDIDQNQDYSNSPAGGYGRLPAISAEENELLWAEAELRLGGAANLADAVTHIDFSRVTRGGLPSSVAYVANLGTPDDGPCMATSVLAKNGGACSLWSTLLYEYEVELLELGPAPYYNQRGLPNVQATNWEQIGTGIYNGPRFIQGLLPGTPREMPVPYKELGVKGEALYTWGGTGAPNSATP